ncbi:hypothetical protein BKP35_09975 [Anaerobacillus arseniciselenatis]|uniref:Uncharacterized protein n=1 Tax=Anaerobacillus arseniciselenatis TaxID=85682 RepID=A0A1S2LKL6_9BACI|nr:DUF1992 domain-containing protein [Anaerobacillus arseniciselenatis]OIJ12884.1 hypothetical protein BKP35_09975 [Anaerobacillus arseniciselenatis]
MSRDLIGDMLKAKEKDVLYEKPRGMGKPLSREVLEGDVLDRTVKHAGYLPEWIKLQNEVRDRLLKVITLINTNPCDDDIDQEFQSINKFIKKYNQICPAKMQKMLVDREHVEKQVDSWR